MLRGMIYIDLFQIDHLYTTAAAAPYDRAGHHSVLRLRRRSRAIVVSISTDVRRAVCFRPRLPKSTATLLSVPDRLLRLIAVRVFAGGYLPRNDTRGENMLERGQRTVPPVLRRRQVKRPP
jgi:hypothetical protein